jgi:hypothetical protein
MKDTDIKSEMVTFADKFVKEDKEVMQHLKKNYSCTEPRLKGRGYVTQHRKTLCFFETAKYWITKSNSRAEQNLYPWFSKQCPAALK